MPYYSQKILHSLGFKSLGKEVQVSTKASIYNHSNISLGDYSRVDDFCVLSGNIFIGKHIHLTPQCLIAGGEPGVIIEDFSTVAYGASIFTQSDDYSGKTLTNSTIPKQYKNEKFSAIKIERHSIIGAKSIIMPGVTLAEGTSIGAMSLVLKSTKSWSIYIGSPAIKIKNRSKNLLLLEKKLLNEQKR